MARNSSHRSKLATVNWDPAREAENHRWLRTSRYSCEAGANRDGKEGEKRKEKGKL